MLFPPSLPLGVLSRAFRASNGELGLSPADAIAFLDACQSDGVPVLGWELWLADHRWLAAASRPLPAPGRWCGLIPFRGNARPAVAGGSGDLGSARREIVAFDFEGLIEPEWLCYVRVNFTLGR